MHATSYTRVENKVVTHVAKTKISESYEWPSIMDSVKKKKKTTLKWRVTISPTVDIILISTFCDVSGVAMEI